MELGSKTKNLLVLDAVDDEVRVGDLVGAGQYPRQVAHHEQSDDDDGDVGHVQLLRSQIINYIPTKVIRIITLYPLIYDRI